MWLDGDKQTVNTGKKIRNKRKKKKHFLVSKIEHNAARFQRQD